MADEFIIFDFETSGLSPDDGDRAIEVAALKIVDNEIVDEFESLMNPNFHISSRITSINGISNEMLEDAPENEEVISDLVDFIDDTKHLVAHNASFDKKFLYSELDYAGIDRSYDFLCSMKFARRLFPFADNHKLKTLLDYRDIEPSGDLHRAMTDTKALYELWVDMHNTLMDERGLDSLNLQYIKKYIG
jgi:DNA polymerase-3 subunit epsilon